VEVLLGNGDGTFQTASVTNLSELLIYPTYIVTGDFTGDGRTDLAVEQTNFISGPGEVVLLLSNGDGTFRAGTPTSLGNFSPTSLVAGDFTGAGRTDVAVAGFDPSTHQGSVEVLLGNGDGTFQTPLPTIETGVYGIPGLVTGDFTGDGRTDLAVVADEAEVLLSQGDGTFQITTPIFVGTVHPSALVTGDFTGDGRADLAVLGPGSADFGVQVLLSDRNGMLQNPTPLALNLASGSSTSLVTGDFNGDGRTDLAIGGVASPSREAAVEVLLGNGDGMFQTATPINTGGLVGNAFVTGDFTGAGRTDLAVAGFDSSSGQGGVEALLANGDGTFKSSTPTDLGSLFPASLVAGDFNGDGRTDLAGLIPGLNSTDVVVLLGNGDGTFQPTTPIIDLSGFAPGAHEFLVTGTFSGDGRTDLAVVDNHITITSDRTDVEVLLGNGDGSFQTMTPLELAGFSAASVVSGDFNRDGRTDLALAGSGEVEILVANGDGTLQATPPINPGDLFPSTLVAGDFIGDGQTDLAVAGSDSSSGENLVEVLLARGDGTFQTTTPINLGSLSPSFLVTGDFTGDGRTDLAVEGFDLASSQYEVKVLLGKGDGTFQLTTSINLHSLVPSSLLPDDFTGDGRTDLAVSGQSGSQVKLSLGNGQFADPGTVADAIQNTPVLADPGDGMQDVFVINQSGSILWRQGDPAVPGSFGPPVTVNPGFPARDMAFVATQRGPLLASTDLKDNAISLYQYSGGVFVRVGSLATGTLPTRIVAGDLTGDGIGDLVVYNAGDGTVSVYLGNGIGGFAAGYDVPVGLGVSDIALADVEGTGHLDLVVTNEITGLVTVLPGKGDATFGAPSVYPAGAGPYGTTVAADGTDQVTSNESTAGFAIGNFTPGAAPGLATIDPGTNSFAMLAGLGGGTLANPVRVLTSTPASLVRAGDFSGNGLTDLALLGPNGVTIERNDGKGNLHPTATYNVGPDPTGLTLADVNHDGKLDLLVGNALGDILVLLGNGDGTFRPYRRLDQNVALAVLPTSSTTPEFIFADQGLDRVVVASGSGSTVLGNHSTGIDNPGAVQLADLNGDGIPDLIVVNSGGNNVLVYPGLGNGQFGPELNGGKGFSVGTDPVSVTVADVNGDGRPDLVVANNGSNDVSLLINTPAPGGGFTFTPGPRLQGGQGPTSTVVTNVPGNSFPDILVTDGNSNQVTLLPGVGNGFFNDQNPRTYSVGSDPSQIMIGNFLPGLGSEILTVNRGSNDVTVISDFLSNTPVFDTFSTGGVEPVAAFGFEPAGQTLESLVVANGGNGLFTLLGGPEGLELEQTLSDPELPEPSALALAALSGNEVSFYATTAGMEAAFTLAFILPGFTPAGSASPIPGSASALAEAPGQLVALSETSLALVGTLLITVPSTSSTTGTSFLAASGNPAEANTASGFVSIAPSQGQSLFAQLETEESGGGEPAETVPEAPQGEGQAQGPARGQGAVAPPWVRSLLGLDRLFDEIREEHQEALPGKDEGEPAVDAETPATPAPRPAEPVRSLDEDDGMSTEAIDAVIDALSWVPLREGEAPSEPDALLTRGSDGASPSRRMGQNRPEEPVALGMLLVTTTVVIVRANPAAGPGAKPGDRRPPGRSRPSPVGARL
jgi:hypothetical protein